MATITWRNIQNDGGFGAASGFMKQASEQVGQGFTALDNVISNYQKTQEANRLNTQENIKADFMRQMNALRAQGPEAVQNADGQDFLTPILAKYGYQQAPRDLDPAATLREMLIGARQDQTATNTYLDQEANRALRPVVDELSNASLTGNEDVWNRIFDKHKASLAQQGKLGEVQRQFQTDQRDNYTHNRQLTQHGQEDARQASRRAVQEIIGGLGTGLTAEDDHRAFMSRVDAALQANDTVLPEDKLIGLTQASGYLKSRFDPTYQEQQAREREDALNKQAYDSQVAEIDKEIERLDAQTGQFSPVVLNPENISPGSLSDQLRDNYSLWDAGIRKSPAGGRAFGEQVGLGFGEIGRGLGGFMGTVAGAITGTATDVFRDTSPKDINRLTREAAPLLKKYNLTNLNEAHIIMEAARMAQRGDAGDGNKRQVRLGDLNFAMMERAAVNLDTQLKEQAKLKVQRDKLIQQRTEVGKQFILGTIRSSGQQGTR